MPKKSNNPAQAEKLNALIATLEEDLKQKGTASNLPISVNALGFIIFGHALHHLHVLKERYSI